MAINNVTGFPGNANNQRTGEGSAVQVGRSEPTAPQQQNGRPSTADTVSLTDASARLLELESALAELPVVDTQRVEALQQAIEEGSYEIDARRIADKMLGFESDLNQTR